MFHRKTTEKTKTYVMTNLRSNDQNKTSAELIIAMGLDNMQLCHHGKGAFHILLLNYFLIRNVDSSCSTFYSN